MPSLFRIPNFIFTCTKRPSSRWQPRGDTPPNTAKLSSPILLQRTVYYDVGTNPPRRGAPTTMADKTGRRRRSSSILQVYHEPPEPIEQLSDQSALPNLNANWVNAKGGQEYRKAVVTVRR